MSSTELTGHESVKPTRSKLQGRSAARRMLSDTIARRIVTLGGLTIIVSILAIFGVIAAQAYPLFKSPTADLVQTVAAPIADPLAIGVDEYREIAYLIHESGFHFQSLVDGRSISLPAPVELDGATIVAVSSPSRLPTALVLSDGRAISSSIDFQVAYADNERTTAPELTLGDPFQLVTPDQKVSAIAHTNAPDGLVTVAAVNEKELVIQAVRERRVLIGKPKREVVTNQMSLVLDGSITQLLLDERGEDLFAGTAQGELVLVEMTDPAEAKLGRAVAASSVPKAAVTAMSFLIGDRTVIVGDAAGGISSWQILRGEEGERTLRKLYQFPGCRGSVVSLAPSARDKGFVAVDSTGAVHLYYGTTGARLIKLDAPPDTRAAVLAPKADGILSVDHSGRIQHWSVSNPHPEINFHSLFGKVWYEGYDRPEFVWQSTGGTDDFEAKFSLTPLIFGTLKGTLYALAFAVPIALLAALYTSQFMHPDIKRYIKPTVEIMAALPSVVLGFIAGLWLAPVVERVGPGIVLFPIVAPFLILSAFALWRFAPGWIRLRVRTGGELLLILPVIVAAGAVAFYAGELVEYYLLGGDYRTWLHSVLGLTFDQRNSLVVGFAMGFAVIPIIFTIAEDSLSNVPQHLAAGSLALGATRWQTAMQVVVPTASPGIFSAIMIGFGRAVGETMIVLMATGNTPVMDWSPFNGFRALSANIAVELPEAPEGGTLYRVLFLAALLLFFLTFFLNTLAELVRLKLRSKYRYL